MGVKLSKDKAYRAKKKAIELIQGDGREQFKHLRTYVEELLKSNPNSTVKIKFDDSYGGHVFERIYVCLEACKTMFATTCRPLIRLDACFLKGDFGGQLIGVVGKDGNNKIYPITYAVVEDETKYSWVWYRLFLRQSNMLNIDYVLYTFTPIGGKNIGILMKEALWRAEGEEQSKMRWNLSGIPCFHAITCIWFNKKEPEDHFTVLATYSHIIMPTNGPQLWPTNVTHPINPPVIRRYIGHPKKNRNKVNDEPRIRNTPSRTLQIVKCKKCGRFGHNKRTCKGKRAAERAIPKGGNKKAGKKGDKSDKGEGQTVIERGSQASPPTQ
ncbi:uncharacterized protein LOC127095397 [Lathyrus oleraceus]|uniref:uncharacterized protein LOC127095397 n=1 Tax=Pisum sativum TaxID=3888 RepID=UPI0021D3E75F|nr:uncharacterized protein LOC127095397 [Pisum sativum]